MATSTTPGLDVLGVFLVVLGSGVILDGDWLWRGAFVAALGAGCLLSGRTQRRAP